MAKSPALGHLAPPIALHDQNGKLQKLSDRRGKWTLVYFYPKDDTPGCTTEACGIRDEWAAFRAAGIEVLGISADSATRHKKFAAKYELPFTLLADEDKSVIRSYGAFGKKKFMGREFDGILRHSFLIDPTGKLAKAYTKVKPAEHAAEVLADVRALASGAAPAAGAAAPKPARKKAAKATPAAKAPARKQASTKAKRATRKS